VQQAGLGLLAVRVAESLLFGCAATMATLAAAVSTGVRPGLPGAWCVALLAGTAAGLAWWLEHRRERHGLARLLDRRLHHQGALLAAHDAEQRGRDTACARLLRRRVLDRLRAREAVRSILPPLAPPVIAPLLGAFLLAGAIERTRAAERLALPDPERLAAGLSAQLGGIRAEAAEGETEAVDPSAVRALFGLEERARALQAGLEAGAPAPDLQAEIRALDRGLFEQAARLGAHPELEKELSAARAWLDGTRAALEAQLAEGAGAPGAGDRAGRPVAGGGGALSPIPSTDRSAPGGPRASTPEPASSATGTWWSGEHDPVVERWIESRRDALSSPGED